MRKKLPDDIGEAIEKVIDAIGYAASGDGMFIEDANCNEARADLDAVILKHISGSDQASRSSEQTFPCPKCGVNRSWLPACAQDECPLLDFDGKSLGRSALAEEGRE